MPVPAPQSASTDAGDEIRERLLDAAARVFADKGYDGTKIQTIVRQAGLSTGAVYGRFTSKTDLLREAVITRSMPQVARGAGPSAKVADLVARGASDLSPGLSDAEAILLETYVTARREPEVGAALAEANDRWHQAVAPLVEAALVDGTVGEGVDPHAVLFLVRVLRIGMLLHRGSGLPTPDPEGWEALVARVVASFGRPAADDAPSPTEPDLHTPDRPTPDRPTPEGEPR